MRQYSFKCICVMSAIYKTCWAWRGPMLPDDNGEQSNTGIMSRNFSESFGVDFGGYFVQKVPMSIPCQSFAPHSGHFPSSHRQT